jgi:hypothetical protein
VSHDQALRTAAASALNTLCGDVLDSPLAGMLEALLSGRCFLCAMGLRPGSRPIG